MVELAKYLGIGYRELIDCPQWFIETAAIRMHEEAEYSAFKQRQLQKQTQK